MFSYIPLDPSLTVGSKIGEDTNDIEMMEANMIIVRKSDFTRQLLKWLVNSLRKFSFFKIFCLL